MNGHGKLFYESGQLAYDGLWYKDEFHGRGKVYNESPEPLDSSFDYTTFQDEEKYWKVYDGTAALTQGTWSTIARRATADSPSQTENTTPASSSRTKRTAKASFAARRPRYTACGTAENW
jgi:hypothetical protein